MSKLKKNFEKKNLKFFLFGILKISKISITNIAIKYEKPTVQCVQKYRFGVVEYDIFIFDLFLKKRTEA